MSKAFTEIDELVFRLRSLQPMKDEYRKKLDKKFRLEFNYNSNHIEGNTLTYSHTEMLLIFDKVTGDYDAREIEEMKAHDIALQMIRQQAQDKERDLTENFIRELNEVILVRPFYKEAITPDGQETRRLIEPGKYKEFPNSVRLANGEIFDYASPAETPALMSQLMVSYRNHQNEHPLWQAAMLHYDFVRIHPFDDGNGRVARLLMNYVLLRHDLPPVIIRSSDKKNYITALNKADTGDKEAFVKYIEDQLKWSLEISIKAAQGENIDEADDLDKEIALLKKDLPKEDIISSKRNAQSIVEAFHNNIFPLFMAIEEKSTELKPFFLDHDRKMRYHTAGNPDARLGLGTKKSTWDSMISNWLDKRVKNDTDIIISFDYNYFFKGFKKNQKAPTFQIAVNITFNAYNYEIKAFPEIVDPIIVPYGKKLSEDELRTFYTPLIKQVIESIKFSTGK